MRVYVIEIGNCEGEWEQFLTLNREAAVKKAEQLVLQVKGEVWGYVGAFAYDLEGVSLVSECEEIFKHLERIV